MYNDIDTNDIKILEKELKLNFIFLNKIMSLLFIDTIFPYELIHFIQILYIKLQSNHILIREIDNYYLLGKINEADRQKWQGYVNEKLLTKELLYLTMNERENGYPLCNIHFTDPNMKFIKC